MNETVETLAALAQVTRLDAFRRLVAAEPEGLAAGDLARALAVPQNTLSAHLAVLARSGLVASERQGRSIVYRAEVGRLTGLVDALVTECCGGRPERCIPVESPVSCRLPNEAIVR